MSKKKNKFELGHLVHDGYIKEGQTLFFVSDPKKSCKVIRQTTGEYKVEVAKEILTVHAFAQRCLGQDPPDHATKWLRAENGKTLFDLWHQEDDLAMAA